MRQMIEKSFLDWSRDKTPKVQVRGLAAVLEQQAKAVAAVKSSGTARFVWPSAEQKSSSRYMSRRIGIS